MNEFFINPEFLTMVVVKEEKTFTSVDESLVPEEYRGMFNKPVMCTRTDDHEQFKILREQLEKDGYIKIQRGWWNGDSTLKPFSLNGMKFKKGEQFPCGSALGIRYQIFMKDKNVL